MISSDTYHRRRKFAHTSPLLCDNCTKFFLSFCQILFLRIRIRNIGRKFRFRTRQLSNIANHDFGFSYFYADHDHAPRTTHHAPRTTHPPAQRHKEQRRLHAKHGTRSSCQLHYFSLASIQCQRQCQWLFSTLPLLICTFTFAMAHGAAQHMALKYSQCRRARPSPLAGYAYARPPHPLGRRCWSSIDPSSTTRTSSYTCHPDNPSHRRRGSLRGEEEEEGRRQPPQQMAAGHGHNNQQTVAKNKWLGSSRRRRWRGSCRRP